MTLIERLLGAPAGTEVEVPLHLIVSDDWTTPALAAPLEALGTRRAAAPVVVVHDHTRPPDAYRGADRERVRALAAARDAFARRFGAEVIEGRGIQHHVLPALGRVRPGMRVLANDSHAPTLGAYGAAAFAGQPTTVAAALHTGTLRLRVPATLRIVLLGRLRSGVSARDAALALLARLRDRDGVPRRAVGAALEFGGPGLAHLSMGQRSVLANVAPEALAATAVFPVDEVLRATLGRAAETNRPDALPPAGPAEGAGDVLLDLGAVEPGVARGPDPGDVVSLARMAATRVHRVFVGTCAGGGYEEIAAFAAALSGPVAVPTQVAPASEADAVRLEADGVLARLRSAGVEVLPPGCGACFGFGVGRLAPGEVAVTTGNRNGRGRMGSPDATIHLASGRTAGLAASSGRLGTDRSIVEARTRSGPTIAWPRRGNVVRLLGTVTTDDLTPSAVPGVGTSADTDPAVLRRLLLHHLDPGAADRDLRGTIVVAGDAFGMGSNRASSVRALRAAGIVAVVARSIAPLYAWGARDEGFPLVALDDDAFHEAITPDAVLTLDLDAGEVRVDGRTFRVPPDTGYERALRDAGGVVPYLRNAPMPYA